MQYLVRGRLRRPCRLSPTEHFALAVREWALVLGWVASGRAAGYGRLGTIGGGAIRLLARSESEARRLAASTPFAPYADLAVDPVPDHASGRAGERSGARRTD